MTFGVYYWEEKDMILLGPYNVLEGGGGVYMSGENRFFTYHPKTVEALVYLGEF